jgi:hypothetical protein
MRAVLLRTTLVILASAALGVAALAAPAGASPRGANGQIAYDNGVGVVTANPDGSSASLLVPSSCCGDFSPDGSKLVVPYLTDDDRIGTWRIVNVTERVHAVPINDPTLNMGCDTGSWSPDGNRLACETWDDSNPARNGVYTISSAVGSGLTRITSNPLGGHDIPGSYSPNGKRIVFIRYDPNGTPAGMFVVKTNDGQLRQILPRERRPQHGGSIGLVTTGQRDHRLLHVTPDVFGSIWVVHAVTAPACTRFISGLNRGASFSIPMASGATEFAGADGKKIIFAA